jgi:hypothetical protein
VTVTILGIRHHGPGSARSVRDELRRLAPDVVLVEGPPEANDVLTAVGAEGLKPPVALLVYATDRPEAAGFYPFAEFSPEWQAIRYANEAGVPVRCIDLAAGLHRVVQAQLTLPEDEAPAEVEAPAAVDPSAVEPAVDPAVIDSLDEETLAGLLRRHDPMTALAEIAGDADGERFWDRLVESRGGHAAEAFEAIGDAMAALREHAEIDEETRIREAAMRREIRAAIKSGAENLVVVCGAWHAPALRDLAGATADDKALKALGRPPRMTATWVPWTYGRLATDRGYGAGIVSPGWYEHLWTTTDAIAPVFFAKAARAFRKADLPVSSAHLIEAARLADALAAMRGRRDPILEDIVDATRAVMTDGSDVPLAVVRRELIVGTRIGTVPESVPTAPLAADFERRRKALRLKVSDQAQALDLDLRTPTDLGRSHLLHRLALLGIHWGAPRKERLGHGSGTFHEFWKLVWKPEFAVDLVVASRYGNTIQAAATAKAMELAGTSDRLATLTELLERVLLASLPEAAAAIVARLGAVAAVAADVPALMAALPPLARVARYGNVRGTEASMVGGIVDATVTRICVGLAPACASLDQDAAREMGGLIDGVSAAIGLLDDAGQRAAWQASLARLAEDEDLAGLVRGRACRILLDERVLSSSDVEAEMGRSLSAAADPADAAGFVEGFLRDSGLVLLHDQALFGVLDEWLAGLDGEAFEGVLPLLRRTIGSFAAPERRALGERAAGVKRATRATIGFDESAADAVLPILSTILGIELAPAGATDGAAA